jgi:ribosomal protein S18 acetylase RimI-like enzyme
MATVSLRAADKHDCLHIARLGLLAGEGIPAYFWGQASGNGLSIEQIGALRAADETANFSFRNTHIAEVGGSVAGMMLAYRLQKEELDLGELPDFLRPLIELEQQVADTFYINMIATYPEYRGQQVATRLLAMIDDLGRQAGCDTTSIQVFEQNSRALGLYQHLGFETLQSRAVIPHRCHPYSGRLLLLTRPIPRN